MKVPFFTLANYSDIMREHHDQQDTSDWIDFWDILDVMQVAFVDAYRDVDARQIGTYVSQQSLAGTCHIGSQQCSVSDGLVLCKLLCPTLHRCTYFYRNRGEGSHLWLDIIMPQWSPIMSVTTGTVIEVNHRDGVSQDEWNHIVIKSDDGYEVSYEHLDSMHVSVGQRVDQWYIIAGCGSTGHSTQYHLHLQIDRPTAPFYPYWHAQGVWYAQHTIDPLPYLHSISPRWPFVDMPGGDFDEAIVRLVAESIVRWYQGKVYPYNELKRYEMALLIDRVCKKYAIYDTLPVQQEAYTPYNDVGIWDVEFVTSLNILQKYGIMKWHAGSFFPDRPLLGEECLALLGRIFYGLEDNNSSPWREDYFNRFVSEWLISPDWTYIWSPILRQEIFALLRRLLDQKNYV